MLWFRHFTDLLSGPPARELESKFGAAGPLAAGRLYELMAQYLDSARPDEFDFSLETLRTVFGSRKRAYIARMLDAFAKNGFITGWNFYNSENRVFIACDRIAELATRYAARKIKETKK